MPTQQLEKNTKEQLQAKDNRILRLEKEIERLKKSLKKQRYGLVWMDVPEAFEDDVENKLPILKEKPELAIKNNDGKPTHILIEGDNYHALTCLNYTHKGKIDVIYIDPPYNTGSDGFRYKDKRILDKFPDGTEVPKDHPYRHSYWLSFMRKRLELAKDLLTKTGVIFMSIDDNEVAQLRLLADDIFGGNNFVAQLVWAAGRKNDSKLISVSHEYILCYVKSIELYKEQKIIWRTRKEGIDSIYKIYNSLKRKYKDNYKKIEEELNEWFGSLPNSDPAKRQRHYSCVDERGIYFPDNISWPGGGGPTYEVLHPVTGKPCKVPSRGWMFAKSERMQQIIAEGRVHFGVDENNVPCIKSYLKDREFEVPYSIFYQDGRAATKRLREIFDKDLFSNPKDENVLAQLINFSASSSATILDFFAGSGTTAHSVLKLNASDKGTRQFILVTNNEGKIMSDVCYPRVKKIVNGYKDSTGFGGSIKYYKTAFVGKNNILNATDRDKIELAHNAGELLAIAENTLDLVKQTKCFQVFENHNQFTAVYFKEENDKFDDFVAEVKKLKKNVSVYVFSWENEEMVDDFEGLNHIRIKTIPQPILEIYKQIYNLV